MWVLQEYTEKQFITIAIITCVVSLIIAFVLGFVCRSIVRGKGYPDTMNHGFAWGFWLGLIGLIVCAVKPVYNPNGNGQFYYTGQPYNGQPYNGQPYNGQPYNGQPAADSWQCSCGTVNSASESKCHICGAPRYNGTQS